MGMVLALIAFVYLTYKSFRLLYTPVGYLRSPYDKRQLMACSGTEMMLVFIFATGVMGIMPVLSVRLAILEVLCVLGILYSKRRPIYSVPVVLYFVFMAWTLIGLTYTPMPGYGVRMMLKYIYPLLVALLASAVVRDGEIFLKSMTVARWVAIVSAVIASIPILRALFGQIFWNRAALATHYITMAVFSLGLYYFSNERRRNLLWFIAFCLPCVLWVFRTDIMGTMIALSAFFVIKYRLKSLPILVVLACLSVASIFCIPSVKEKMYFRPDEVTVMDFLTNNVDENNINTSGRKVLWGNIMPFYENNKLAGAGTGRTQTWFYEEAVGWERGGQTHNDFLVLMCDNGLIGLSLYLLMYVAVLVHCIMLYHKQRDPMVRLCAIVAGASLFGVLVTMYSDNTVSYSMATLSYPWGLYGMALGFAKAKKE